MSEITIQHNGQELKAPLESVKLPEGYSILKPGDAPEGYVPEHAVAAKIKDKMKHARRTLAQDTDFVKSILEQSGVPLGDDGRPAIPKGGVDMDKLKDAWSREALSPLKTRVEELEGQNRKLLQSRKRAEIVQAALSAGVREELLKPATGREGDPTVWENMIGQYIDYDAENDMFAQRDGDGFAYGTGKNGKPWAGVQEFHEKARKNETLRSFFRDSRPGDTGLGATGGGSQSTYRISREEARDSAKYRAAKMAADKAGRQLEVTD